MTATSVPLAVKAVIGTAWVLNDGKTYVRQTHDGRLVCINSACIAARMANSCVHVECVEAYEKAEQAQRDAADPYVNPFTFPPPTGYQASVRHGTPLKAKSPLRADSEQ